MPHPSHGRWPPHVSKCNVWHHKKLQFDPLHSPQCPCSTSLRYVLYRICDASLTYKLKLKHTTALPTFQFSVPGSTARPTAITMAPAPKTKAAAIKMAPAGNDQQARKVLAAMARPLEAASLLKMSQNPNTRAAEQHAEEPPPKIRKFAPPASWLGNHEQNDDAEQNGESEQNAEAAQPANAAGTSNASPAETHQPAPASAAESKPQEACNK